MTSAYVKDFGETRWRDKQGAGRFRSYASGVIWLRRQYAPLSFVVIGGDHRLRWVDLSGRVPKYREEVTASARENKQVPDEVAVAQSLSREERHARRVRQPPSHEPR